MGQRVFTGNTVAHILASVLQGPIDLAILPKETPRAVRDLLKRCLDRDVKTRLRDIGEARILLDGPMEESPAEPVQPPPAPRRSTWLPWCIAAFFLLALMPANILHFRESPPPDYVLRYTLAPRTRAASTASRSPPTAAASPSPPSWMASANCGFVR